jgi:hypothetical protein
MKEVIVRAGSSLLASTVAYVGLTVLADDLEVVPRLAVACVLGLFAFAAAVWATKARSTRPRRPTSILSDLSAERARIEDVSVELPTDQEAKVASDIEVEGSLEIKGVSVKPSGDKR